jgi:hypothetical protein
LLFDRLRIGVADGIRGDRPKRHSPAIGALPSDTFARWRGRAASSRYDSISRNT